MCRLHLEKVPKFRSVELLNEDRQSVDPEHPDRVTGHVELKMNFYGKATTHTC